MLHLLLSNQISHDICDEGLLHSVVWPQRPVSQHCQDSKCMPHQAQMAVPTAKLPAPLPSLLPAYALLPLPAQVDLLTPVNTQ